MKMQSKVDPYTFYTVTSGYVRICRHGDKLTMPYMQIPEQAKRFRPEIQEELMAIFEERHPIVSCPNCGKQFRKESSRKYCCQECYTAAARKRRKETEKIPRESKCKWCGKTFVSVNYNQFCSYSCKNKYEATKRQERVETKEPRESHLNEKLQQAAALGINYAELQKQETLRQVGRVVI